MIRIKNGGRRLLGLSTSLLIEPGKAKKNKGQAKTAFRGGGGSRLQILTSGCSKERTRIKNKKISITLAARKTTGYQKGEERTNFHSSDLMMAMAKRP